MATLEHSVAMIRLLGGGITGDMGKPLHNDLVEIGFERPVAAVDRMQLGVR